MKRLCTVLAAVAVLQLAFPAQAANPIMVAICGGSALVPLPIKNHDSDKTCSKICHSAMRKRGGGDNCCSEEGGEEED